MTTRATARESCANRRAARGTNHATAMEFYIRFGRGGVDGLTSGRRHGHTSGRRHGHRGELDEALPWRDDGETRRVSYSRGARPWSLNSRSRWRGHDALARASALRTEQSRPCTRNARWRHYPHRPRRARRRHAAWAQDARAAQTCWRKEGGPA
jgi:hypothetical protein